jgi:hypothetical protein
MKPTAAELNLRIEEVKQALLSGMPRYAIVENVKKRYGVSISTGDNYIAKARKALDNDLAKARPHMLAEHIAHRRDLRTRLRKAGDLNGELKAAQDEAKLLGLYAPQTMVLQSWQDEVVELLKRGEIAPEDVRAAYPELAQQFFARAGVSVGDG